MRPTHIKQCVKDFRREHHLKEVTAGTLETALKQQGFTIIYFNPILNDPDIETVINAFGLQEMVRQSNGFLFLDDSHRLLFVREGLTDDERKIVFAHEEGHYCCGHTAHADVAGRSVTEEYEANEFAHFLLNKTPLEKIAEAARLYRKQIAALFVIALIAACAGTAVRKHKERQLYEGEFYVTMHGEKYHRKDCVTIEDHEIRRLTKEDVESGTYEPCSVCRPDQ